MKTIVVNSKVYRVTEKEYKSIEKFNIICDKRGYFEQIREEINFIKSLVKDKNPILFVDRNVDLIEEQLN